MNSEIKISVDRHRASCKQQYKEYRANGNLLTYMQYQHRYALQLGYASWSDLLKHCEVKK